MHGFKSFQEYIVFAFAVTEIRWSEIESEHESEEIKGQVFKIISREVAFRRKLDTETLWM